MYTCKNCGQTYSEPVKFCGNCGGNAFDSSNYTTPSNSTYGNPTPVYAYEPAPEAASGNESKVPAIVGMACGISALLFAFVAFGECIDQYYFWDALSAYIMYTQFMSTPLAIVGLVMSFKAGNALKGMSIAGKVTSFVSFGVCALAFLVLIGSTL